MLLAPTFNEIRSVIKTLKSKILLGVLLVACLSTTLVVVPVSADNLLKTDFQKESFAKTVDYFDYARALAQIHGLPKIPIIGTPTFTRHT